MHGFVEFGERLLGRPERLLVHDTCATGQVVSAERAGGLGERAGWQGQVVHQLCVCRVEIFPRLPNGRGERSRVVRGETAAGESQPPGERLPVGVVVRHSELVHDVAHVVAELIVGYVAPAGADQHPLGVQEP